MAICKLCIEQEESLMVLAKIFRMYKKHCNAMDYFKIVEVLQPEMQKIVDQFIAQARKLCMQLKPLNRFVVN